ncbi:phage tail protein I [Enterobacter bugandensis]|nr:phage tail protein I [Enterobacter bugandensis]
MTFRTLLPANASRGELAQEMVHSHIGDLLFDVRTVKNPDLCPVDFLPWLAWEYGITYWEDTWTEDEKRAVIRSAAAVNKKRGTPWAVQHALGVVNRKVDVVEWFSDTPKADPYTFRLIIHGESITTDELIKTRDQACDTKNARSWLSALHILGPPVRGTFWFGGGCYQHLRATIKSKKRHVVGLSLPADIYVGGGCMLEQSATIKAKVLP